MTHGAGRRGASRPGHPDMRSDPSPAAAASPDERIHPIRLARMLAACWQSLPENQKAVCMEELQEGGVMPLPEMASPLADRVHVEPGREAVADLKLELLRTKLQMADAEHAGPLDLIQMLNLLIELAGHLKNVGDILATVWPAWQGLAKRSRVHPSQTVPQPLTHHLRDYLDGRPQGTLNAALRDQVTAARLLVAILGGIGQGGQAFARDCSRHFDPSEIRQQVRSSRGRPPTPEECWQRFEQLANRLSPGELEQQLLQQIAAAAESLFHAHSSSS